jgi:uncharacterized protein (TIGR02600 family)
VGLSTGFAANRSLVNASMGDAATIVAGIGSKAGLLGNRKDYKSSVKPITFTNGPLATFPLGDWSSNPGGDRDGGTLVRPDQNYGGFYVDPNSIDRAQTPFFTEEDLNNVQTASFFSPNRQVPSPVIMGCLPRSTTTGWETLAFSPNPAKNNHPGSRVTNSSNNAPDHLWLDLFWMPVSEPYPISDPFSTAGKVNLNYRMMPFNYIQRKTALHAALKSTWLTAIPVSTAADYKSPHFMRTNFPDVKTRYKIHIPETLKAFDAKFDTDIFRSASQLSEMFLYPASPVNGSPLVSYNTSESNIKAWWNAQSFTSDTAREQPYDHLYSRVTTKSNTYTVHWRAQVLRKIPATGVGIWDETRDRVASELRGSTLIERYIDPNTKDDPATPSINEAIPDYANAAVLSDAATQTLSNYYKWRVVAENYFQP